MLVNSAIYINGIEVLSIDDFTAQLINGRSYIWNLGEFDHFQECLNYWVDMPLDDGHMIPTFENNKFKFMDERRK